MFNLIYRDGARENAGRYETLEKADASAKLECGTAVELSGGKAAEATDAVYGIVAADSSEGESSVVVLKVEHDMVFAVPATVTGLVKGDKVTLVDATKVGAKGDGPATIVNICEGNRVEVRFE